MSEEKIIGKYGCISTNWQKMGEEPIETRLVRFTIDAIPDELPDNTDACYSILEDLVKKGAIWMLEELKKDKKMITRELITKYLNSIKNGN